MLTPGMYIVAQGRKCKAGGKKGRHKKIKGKRKIKRKKKKTKKKHLGMKMIF